MIVRFNLCSNDLQRLQVGHAIGDVLAFVGQQPRQRSNSQHAEEVPPRLLTLVNLRQKSRKVLVNEKELEK